MHKINWWRVASIALLAGSALLGFGHDLIEDQKSEDELRGAGRSAASAGRKEQHELTRKIQSALWKKIQTEQIKEI
mgnify:CR=1 FL=1|jgi:hypothetical protein